MSTVTLRDAFTVERKDLRKTRDGYLVATPRVARTGIQDYLGSEVGRPDLAKVRVYRPPEEVFSPDSMRSYTHRPMTNDHPPVPVTDKNWKKYAVGHTGDEVFKDGSFLRVPMMLADAASIEDVETGEKVELSNGYSTEIDWTPGTCADGDYDAVQRNIRSNHIALVKRARGGEKLKFGDSAPEPIQFLSEQEEHQFSTDEFNPGLHPRVPAGSPAGGQFTSKGEAEAVIAENRRKWSKAKVEKVVEVRSHVAPGIRGWLGLNEKTKKERYVIKTDAKTKDSAELSGAAERLDDAGGSNFNEGEGTMAKTILVDGISCEMTDTAAQVVQRALDAAAKAVADAATKSTADAAALATAQAQVATLTTQVAAKDAEIATHKAAAEAAKPTAMQLDAMVAERTSVITRGKELIGDKLVVDGKTSAEIRRQVVDALLGDVSKGWTDDQVVASFAIVGAASGGPKVTIPGVHDVAQGFGRPASHAVKVDDAAYASYEKDYLHKGRAA